MTYHRSCCSQQGPPGLENSVAGTQSGKHQAFQMHSIDATLDGLPECSLKVFVHSQEPTHLTLK